MKMGLSCSALTTRLKAPSHDPTRDKDMGFSAPSVNESRAWPQMGTGVEEVPFNPSDNNDERLPGRGVLELVPFPHPCKAICLLSAEEPLIYRRGQEGPPQTRAHSRPELFQPMHSHLATGPFCLWN